MSDELKKLLEGLPIKVLDKDCAEIDGGRYVRSEIKHWADNAGGTGQRLGWRTLLRVMDEYEESAPVNPGREFEELKNYTIQECGKGIELKPTWEPEDESDVFVAMPPKPERPVTMKVQREDPFTGAHWDERQDADSATLHLRALQRDCDLRDEVRRLKER